MHEVKPGQWPLSNNHDPNNSSNRNSQNGGGGDHLVRGEYYFRELFVLRDVAFQPEVDAVVGVPKPEHARLVRENLPRLRRHLWVLTENAAAL